MPKATQECLNCLKEFTFDSWKGHTRKYCSFSCKQRYFISQTPEKFFNRGIEKRISQCRECGKDFWKRHLDKFFCNTECYLIWKRKTTKRKKFNCYICGNQYQQDVSLRTRKINVCSKECRTKHYYEQKKICMTRKFQSAESIRLFGEKCEKCGHEENVECHHIDHNPKNNPLDGSNWMRLCCSCHKKVHGLCKKINRFIDRKEILSMKDKM